MDGADADDWSSVAEGWAELWGRFAEPVWQIAMTEAGIGPGSRLLDVGCGSGDFLAYAAKLGASTAGIDPAPGMVAIARAAGVDARHGSTEHLPWSDGEFDVVTAFNALQFAEDPVVALTEFKRVGRMVVVANWAEGTRNDVNTVEEAVALAAGEQLPPDGPLRQPGGLEELFAESGLDVLKAGLVEVPWRAPDEETLVRGVLLGEDAATMAERAPTVLTAARPFRAADGGYLLENAFRYAVGRSA
jgi:SAM-dependent methyltransferase